MTMTLLSADIQKHQEILSSIIKSAFKFEISNYHVALIFGHVAGILARL